MLALHAGPSVAARAEADVPRVIVATRHTTAQATASELIIIFVNLVFIVVIFFLFKFSCFGLL
jgi:hypothetical protein